MTLYEMHGTVTVTGTVFVEREGDLSDDDAQNVLKDQLAGHGARGLQYAEVDSTEIDVEYADETDTVYATYRPKG